MPVLHNFSLETIQKNVTALLPSLTQKDQIKRILDDNNASLEETIKVVSSLMHYGEKEATKINAAKEILNLHGVGSDKGSEMIINIVCPDNVNMQNILNPSRENQESL